MTLMKLCPFICIYTYVCVCVYAIYNIYKHIYKSIYITTLNIDVGAFAWEAGHLDSLRLAGTKI